MYIAKASSLSSFSTIIRPLKKGALESIERSLYRRPDALEDDCGEYTLEYIRSI